MEPLTDAGSGAVLAKKKCIITGHVPQMLNNKYIHLLPVSGSGAEGMRNTCLVENGYFSFTIYANKPARYLLYMVVPGTEKRKAVAGYKTLFVEPGIHIKMSLAGIQQPAVNLFAGSKLFRTLQQDYIVSPGVLQHCQQL